MSQRFVTRYCGSWLFPSRLSSLSNNRCNVVYYSRQLSVCLTVSTRPRSPYAVLQLRTSATTEDIKSSFRKLAKLYHPDLNLPSNRRESESKMTELIDAYDHLLNDDDGDLGRRRRSTLVGDSRVALACEMYTIDELRSHHYYNVYTIQIVFQPERGEPDNDGDTAETKNGGTEKDDVSANPVVRILAHPDDSISDLKRQIQDRFLLEWGLNGRRFDRDNIATGWELVQEQDGTVLSYHLFLNSYNIKNGDLIHAVVTK